MDVLALNTANMSNLGFAESAMRSLARRPNSFSNIDVYHLRTSEAFDAMADGLSPRPTDQHEVFVLNAHGIVEVYCNVHISFLRNINTTQQTFECTIIVSFEWQEKNDTQIWNLMNVGDLKCRSVMLHLMLQFVIKNLIEQKTAVLYGK